MNFFTIMLTMYEFLFNVRIIDTCVYLGFVNILLQIKTFWNTSVQKGTKNNVCISLSPFNYQIIRSTKNFFYIYFYYYSTFWKDDARLCALLCTVESESMRRNGSVFVCTHGKFLSIKIYTSSTHNMCNIIKVNNLLITLLAPLISLIKFFYLLIFGELFVFFFFFFLNIC